MHRNCYCCIYLPHPGEGKGVRAVGALRDCGVAGREGKAVQLESFSLEQLLTMHRKCLAHCKLPTSLIFAPSSCTQVILH